MVRAAPHPFHEGAPEVVGGHVKIIEHFENTERSVWSSRVNTPIEIRGLVKTVRQRPGPRRPRPQRRARARCTASSDPTVRQVHHHPGAAGAAARRRRARSSCSGGDPWARRRRPPPTARLRARRRDALAQPDRRRGHRPARPVARRRSTSARRADLVERFELDPTKKGRTYSKGNRQKVALVAALASDVELLLLDEPTSGLDPLMEAVFQQCVEEFRGRGAHRAALQPHPGRGRAALRPGEHHPRRPAAWSPAPSASCATSPGRRSRAETARPPTARGAGRRARPLGRGAPGRLRGRHRRPCAAAVAALQHAGLVSLTATPPTLEELFLRHYGDELAHGGGAGGRCGDRHLAPPAPLPAPRPVDDPGLVGGDHAALLVAGRQRARASTRPRTSSTRAAASMEGNAAFVAMAGPARALDTIGGQVAWQATGVRRDLRRPHVDVPGRAAHACRGGVRAGRDAARGRRRPSAPPRPPRCWWPLVANLLAGALVARQPGDLPAGCRRLRRPGRRARRGRAGLRGRRPSRRPAHHEPASGVRRHRRSDRRRLRAARDRRRRVARADLAVADRLVPGHARLLRAAVVAAGAARRARQPRPGRSRRGRSACATTARACWPRAPVRRGRPPPSARRSASPGGCSAATLVGWTRRALAHRAGVRVARQRRRRPARRLADHAGDLRPRRRRSRGRLLRHLDPDDGPDVVRYAISTALRPRHDETTGVVEVLLATGLSRRRWLFAQTVLTVAGSAVVVFAAGLGLGLGYALTTGDTGAIGTYLVATLPYARAGPGDERRGAAALRCPPAPRAARLARCCSSPSSSCSSATCSRWPGWLQDLSPFRHLALVPAEELPLGPVPLPAGRRRRAQRRRSAALHPSRHRRALGSRA